MEISRSRSTACSTTPGPSPSASHAPRISASEPASAPNPTLPCPRPSYPPVADLQKHLPPSSSTAARSSSSERTALTIALDALGETQLAADIAPLIVKAKTDLAVASALVTDLGDRKSVVEGKSGAL